MATFLDLPEALHQHVAFHLLLLDAPIMLDAALAVRPTSAARSTVRE
jgi:hypothetical protein